MGRAILTEPDISAQKYYFSVLFPQSGKVNDGLTMKYAPKAFDTEIVIFHLSCTSQKADKFRKYIIELYTDNTGKHFISFSGCSFI